MLAKLDAFMDKVDFVDRVGPEFDLTRVRYTSRSDAVAEFHHQGADSDNDGIVIATTDDNWAHASRLLIPWDVADLVDHVPLGRGAVAIKARSQFGGSSPLFVLYPDGEVKPLVITEPRTLNSSTELVANFDSLYYSLPLPEHDGQWAVDVDAAEAFPVVGTPSGGLLERVPGRDGVMMTVEGYSYPGHGVWRFHSSTDDGASWSQTDILLPPKRSYADGMSHAVGPGKMHAIADGRILPDVPLIVSRLWWTDDEKQFRRISLPREDLPFAGMAFAADGALLLSEMELPPGWYCKSLVCKRSVRIWRLPPGGGEPDLLADAPRIFGPFRAVGIGTSGGWIVARTGSRAIALSADGYTWEKVVPG